MPKATLIRQAARHDVPGLLGIWEELMLMHAERDDRFALASNASDEWCVQAYELLSREDAFFLTAERDGQLAGFCLGWIAKNPSIYRVAEVGFVSEIAVRQVHRRHHIGRTLMQAAARWCRQRGLTELQLSTAVWNDDAISFWRSLGGEPLLVRFRFDLDDMTPDVRSPADDLRR